MPAWHLFKRKWPKSELNIWVDSSWTHAPSPLLKNVRVSVWGRTGALDGLGDVNTDFENFENFKTFLLN